MNFEFSEEAQMLREEARSFLQERCPSTVVRDVIEGRSPYAATLWSEMAAMGWLGAAIPEQFGGSGLGHEFLCILAEELGRVLAPVPFGSSIFLAAEAILHAGDSDDKSRWLPGIADGSRIATLAIAEGRGRAARNGIKTKARKNRLSGFKLPVADGLIADVAIVAAQDEIGIGLYAVELVQDGVTRKRLQSFDDSRGLAEIQFNLAHAERLGEAVDHWPQIMKVIDQAAVLTAFEQVGGADSCLAMARDYAMTRMIFGRSLATFQAIKHRLVDIYVENEIARANAYYGAWALMEGAPELPLAASTARVAAIEAFRIASKENIQIHGGVGFTWEFDCHLYYRRAKSLALTLGGAPYWKRRLVDQMIADRSRREDADGFQ